MFYTFEPAKQPQSLRWHWTRLAGPDAKDFIHRLTTVNVRNLEVGQGAPGCFLNAQGRMQAYFTLWHPRPDEFAFEYEGGTDDGWKKSLLTTIDLFTFAEKMTLTDVEGLECRWLLAEHDPGSQAELLMALGTDALAPHQTLEDEEIRMCHHGRLDYGRPWISFWGRPERLNAWWEKVIIGRLGASRVKEVSLEQLEAWRIEELRPRVDHEITTSTVPLEVGLLDAISQNKGCYPGQEVIERTLTLGSPARKLCHVEGEGTPKKGMALHADSAEVGQITSVHQQGSRFAALAVIRKTHAKDETAVSFEGGSGRVSEVVVAEGHSGVQN